MTDQESKHCIQCNAQLSLNEIEALTDWKIKPTGYICFACFIKIPRQKMTDNVSTITNKIIKNSIDTAANAEAELTELQRKYDTLLSLVKEQEQNGLFTVHNAMKEILRKIGEK